MKLHGPCFRQCWLALFAVWRAYPICNLLSKHKMYFIMACRIDSHRALYQAVELLRRVEGAVKTMTVRGWSGRSEDCTPIAGQNKCRYGLGQRPCG